MATLFADPTLDTTTTSSPLVAAPSSGIGLGGPLSEQGINMAPVMPAVNAASAAGAPPPDPISGRDRDLQPLRDAPGWGKALLMLGEAGAGAQGRTSPILNFLQDKRRERALQVEEGRNNVQTFQEGLNVLNRLPAGADRDNFVETYGSQMGAFKSAFQAVANQPGMAERLLTFGKDSPTLVRAIQADPSGALAGRILSSDGGMKTVGMEIDAKQIPVLQSKVQTLLQGATELSPELANTIAKRGYATPADIGTLNNLAKQNTTFGPAAISDLEQGILVQHADAIYGSVPGIATTKANQAILEDKARQAILHPEGVATQTRTIQRGGQSVTQEFKGGQWVDVPGAAGPKFNPAYQVPKGYEVDPDDPTQLRPIAGGPRDPNRPGAPEQRDKLQADALAMYRAKFPYGPVSKTDPSPEQYVDDYVKRRTGAGGGKPAPGAGVLPPEIVSKLKPGINTTLSDNSVWTLENGQPKKVK